MADLRSVHALCVAIVLSTLAAASSASLRFDERDRELVRETFGLEDFELLELDLPRDAADIVDVQVGAQLLQLHRVNVRAPDFRLRVEVQPGVLVDVTPETPSTYRGAVAGDHGSLVAGSLRERELRASIHPSTGAAWFVQPFTELGETVHVVYRMTQPPLPEGACGTDLLDPVRPTTALDIAAEGSFSGAGGCLSQVRIAIDADHDYFLSAASSVAQVMSDADDAVNGMIAIYARDIGITYALTQVIVRQNVNDPYTSTSPSGRLGEFRNEWNSHQGSVTRDLAHLFTGVDLTGNVIGIALRGTVCATASAYGLTQFTSSSFQSNVNVMSHEVGHNWNPGHCLDPSCTMMCGACASIGEVTSQEILDYLAHETCPTSAPGLVTPVGPRALPDRVHSSGGTVTIDALANDTDGNCDVLSIVALDATSQQGGTLSVSPGTGPGGRDEIVYTPPIAHLASDSFQYTIGDGTLTSQTEVAIYPKLIARYELDECAGSTAVDSSDSGNDGTFVGGPALCQPGASAGTATSVSFDPANDQHVALQPGAELLELRNEFSVAAWIRADSISSVQRVFGCDDWSLGLDGSQLRFTLFGLIDIDSNGLIAAGQWAHVAVTYSDAFVARLYFNGNQVLASDINVSFGLPGPDWFLGSRNSTDETFDGRIDDVQVYGCLLSGAQIAALSINPGLTLEQIENAGTPFCSGDGGDQLGCTSCPCSNDAPQGSPGGCLNGAAQSAEITGSGVPRVTSDTLRIEMTGGNPNTFAVLTSGAAPAPANMVNPCFGQDSGIQAFSLDGLRCVVQSVQRHGSRAMDASGDVGVTNAGWGKPDGPGSGLIQHGGFSAGETRYFQIIYREDPLLGCMRGQNSSNGYAVTMLP